MNTYSNIIERGIRFNNCSIAWRRKYKTVPRGKRKGEAHGLIETYWGVKESIIGEEYYRCFNCGKLVITFHRQANKKDWDKLVYNTNV